MKNITIFVLLLSLFTRTEAQTSATQTQQNNGSFIGLVGGLSMPLGNWKKTAYITDANGAWLANNADNTSSGFAGNGSSFGIEGAYFFSKYVGFGGMLSHSTFNISTKGLDSLSAGYQRSFDVDQVTTTINGSYSIWAFMPGIYLRYPFSNKFSITGKLLAGFTTTSTPNISVDVKDGGVDDGTFTQLSSVANSIGVMGGLGFGYNICNHFAVNLQGNYCYSKPDFFFANLNRVSNAGRLINEYNQPLTFMNVSLGVAYTF
jgi:hypothetical protein